MAAEIGRKGEAIVDEKRRGSFTKILALVSPLVFYFGTISCERGTEVGPKANGPPTITSVDIIPKNPNKGSDLDLTVRSQDPDGDPVMYRYQWIKNDEEMADENRNILKNGKFRKGDLLRVKVIAFDGKVEGRPFLSDPVRILNSPAVIREVWIEPKRACANDNLKVLVKGSDADGDSVNYTYQWEKNGVILSEEKNEIFERGHVKKGDSIAVAVTPSNGESLGTPKKSEPILVSNSPPIIVSSPSNKIDENIYTYQVKTDDPDNDPVIFSLKTAPRGMEINKETGLIRWQIGKEDHGTQTIEIEASDSERAKSFQRYTLSIEVR